METAPGDTLEVPGDAEGETETRVRMHNSAKVLLLLIYNIINVPVEISLPDFRIATQHCEIFCNNKN